MLCWGVCDGWNFFVKYQLSPSLDFWPWADNGANFYTQNIVSRSAGAVDRSRSTHVTIQTFWRATGNVDNEISISFPLCVQPWSLCGSRCGISADWISFSCRLFFARFCSPIRGSSTPLHESTADKHFSSSILAYKSSSTSASVVVTSLMCCTIDFAVILRVKFGGLTVADLKIGSQPSPVQKWQQFA